MIVEAWFLATATAALIWSVLGIVAKKLMKTSSGLAYTYLYSLIALIFYTPVFLYFLLSSSFNFSSLAFLAIIVSGTANILAFLGKNYSIKMGDLSTVIPFTKLQPVFTGILAAIFLAETITFVNAGGLVLVTIGSYVILKENGKSLLDPLRKFKVTKAPKLAAATAMVFAVASIADRFATQAIQPEIYTYFIYLFMTAGLTLYIYTRKREVFEEAQRGFMEDKKLYLLTGLGAAISSYLVFFGFSKAEASKVVPVLQLEIFLSVLAGVLIFDEKNLKEKAIGSVILVAGVIMTSI